MWTLSTHFGSQLNLLYYRTGDNVFTNPDQMEQEFFVIMELWNNAQIFFTQPWTMAYLFAVNSKWFSNNNNIRIKMSNESESAPESESELD